MIMSQTTGNVFIAGKVSAGKTTLTADILQSFLHRQPALGKVAEVKNHETARMLDIYNLSEINPQTKGHTLIMARSSDGMKGPA